MVVHISQTKMKTKVCHHDYFSLFSLDFEGEKEESEGQESEGQENITWMIVEKIVDFDVKKMVKYFHDCYKKSSKTCDCESNFVLQQIHEIINKANYSPDYVKQFFMNYCKDNAELYQKLLLWMLKYDKKSLTHVGTKPYNANYVFDTIATIDINKRMEIMKSLMKIKPLQNVIFFPPNPPVEHSQYFSHMFTSEINSFENANIYVSNFAQCISNDDVRKKAIKYLHHVFKNYVITLDFHKYHNCVEYVKHNNLLLIAINIFDNVFKKYFNASAKIKHVDDFDIESNNMLQSLIVTIMAYISDYYNQDNEIYNIVPQYEIKRKEKCIILGNFINEHFLSNKIHNTLDKISQVILHHGNIICDRFINSFPGILFLFSTRKMYPSKNIFDFTLKCLSKELDTNPHHRVMICIMLNKFFERFGSTLFEHDYANPSNLLKSVIKFVSDVDYFSLFQPQQCFEFHEILMNLITFIYTKIKKEDFSDYDINKYDSFIHKLVSNNNKIFFDIQTTCDNIKKRCEEYTNPIVRTAYVHGVSEEMKYFFSTLIVSIQTFQNVIINSIVKLDKISPELMYLLTNSISGIIRFLKDHKNTLSMLFPRSMETDDITCETLKLIALLVDNSHFQQNLVSVVAIVEELNNKHVKKIGNSDSILINKLIEKTKNICDSAEELPDEFVDPFLMIEIENPVMIPKINRFFDKSSIMSHLHVEQNNPYTRDPMSIEEFLEFNKTEKVKLFVDEFTNKLCEYKKNNKK